MLSVSQLTAQIRELLEPPLARVLVRGEVTGFRGPNVRGHLYFSLKDARAQIDVRIWASQAQRLKFALKDGLSVVIEGALSVYEPQGRYAVLAHRIEPEGVGALALAFEQLKARLVAEGLFGEQRTRPRRALPFLPRRIGVVTSVSGAALRDFLKVLHRRHPRLSVLVCDARVQGEGAAADVVRAIHWLSRSDVDVIVVTRGGGSVEDLWAFNEEAVVRAVFASPVPVVSAVGHEVDVTLCDLVADFRAPTPSAAAEALAPVLSELELGLKTAQSRLRHAAERRLLVARSQLKALEGALGDPRRPLAEQRLFLSEQAERLTRRLRRDLGTSREALARLSASLQRARPQAQLRARREDLQGLRGRLLSAMQRRLAEERERLARPRLELERVSPRGLVRLSRSTLAGQAQRLAPAATQRVGRERQRLSALSGRLDDLSPLRVLGRGYAIARTEAGVVVRRASEVSPGTPLSVRLHQGELAVAVTGVKPGTG